MATRNVRIVRAVFEAVERGDTSAVLSHYDSTAVYDFSRSPFKELAERNVYRGHEELIEFFRERYDFWATIEDELHQVIEVGERVISVVTSRGRGRRSGVEVEQTHCGLWTLEGGRIVRVAWFGTVDEALKAAEMG